VEEEEERREGPRREREGSKKKRVGGEIARELIGRSLLGLGERLNGN